MYLLYPLYFTSPLQSIYRTPIIIITMETQPTSQPYNPNPTKDYKDNENDRHDSNVNGAVVGVNNTCAHNAASTKDLTDLPFDLFILITRYLSPQDLILCRRVSRAWKAAFTDGAASYHFMARHFPRAREMRLSSSVTNSTTTATTTTTTSPMGATGPTTSRSTASNEPPPDWSEVFARVARRYFFLRAARPRHVEKIDVARDADAVDYDCHDGRREFKARFGCRFRPVPPWKRWLRWNEHVATFVHEDTAWTVDDGVLVYREPVEARSKGGGGGNGSNPWVAYDLETGGRTPVPFEREGIVVRRVRLAHGVLVFEWRDADGVTLDYLARPTVVGHRHYATAFDVVRRRRRQVPESESETTRYRDELDIRFRCEWEMFPQAVPLSPLDRLFSAHTATHFAAYLWQPDTPPMVRDAFEYIVVWDISQPSSSSSSSSFSSSTAAAAAAGTSISTNTTEPKIVHTFTVPDLEFLGVRQGPFSASLREIRLDEANVYVHEEEHRWLDGPQASAWPPRHHVVRSTGIPFSGVGPRWFDECCADGDVHMSFCPRAGSLARVLGTNNSSRRNNGNNRNNGNGSGIGNDGNNNARQSLSALLWPGWAPCWRHEDFPYLTVSDALDAAAGVRFVARQCFIMEALSSFVVPRISVQEEEEEGGREIMPGEKGSEEDEYKDGDGDSDYYEEDDDKGVLVAEARFVDEMWGELMGGGKIAGDERWAVGQDGEGRITVLRF
ncbi:hypothetical protein F4811DRAFT_505436 [Daldinia bambusicola]|nr:hypothetical protein F4811DRAFT_505436 [Daldinia bambusicola]